MFLLSLIIYLEDFKIFREPEAIFNLSYMLSRGLDTKNRLSFISCVKIRTTLFIKNVKWIMFSLLVVETTVRTNFTLTLWNKCRSNNTVVFMCYYVLCIWIPVYLLGQSQALIDKRLLIRKAVYHTSSS